MNKMSEFYQLPLPPKTGEEIIKITIYLDVYDELTEFSFYVYSGDFNAMTTVLKYNKISYMVEHYKEYTLYHAL